VIIAEKPVDIKKFSGFRFKEIILEHWGENKN
jgi:hypothetical protein